MTIPGSSRRDEMWVCYNLFQPVMHHLVEKEVIQEDGRQAQGTPDAIKRR
jgi:hypothetical protein